MEPCRTDSPLKQWFRSANCDGRYGSSLLITIAVLTALALGGPAVREALQYQREALTAGQAWRLLTAHLVHLNAEHLLLNVVGLGLLWVLFARDFKPSQWLAIVLLAAGGIDAGLWWFDPAVQWYLGASGVLHAIWSAGAYAALPRRQQFGVVLIALLIVKLAYEQLHGVSAVAQGLPVAVDAHLYGTLAGLVGARALGAWDSSRRRKSL